MIVKLLQYKPRVLNYDWICQSSTITSRFSDNLVSIPQMPIMSLTLATWVAQQGIGWILLTVFLTVFVTLYFCTLCPKDKELKCIQLDLIDFIVASCFTQNTNRFLQAMLVKALYRNNNSQHVITIVCEIRVLLIFFSNKQFDCNSQGAKTSQTRQQPAVVTDILLHDHVSVKIAKPGNPY